MKIGATFTPTPYSTPIPTLAPTIAPTATSTRAPNLTPTATSTRVSLGVDIEGRVNRNEDELKRQRGLIETLQAQIERLSGFIDAINARLASIGEVTPEPTATPTATNTPVIVVEPTPTATSVPTATPTRVPPTALAPGCIRKAGLGWLTGIWNEECVSDKTPSNAKTGTRYARFYALALDSTAEIDVSVSSDDVDGIYLYLLEGRGNAGDVVFGGAGKINEQLQAGLYTIEVTTYDVEAVGDFTLTLDIAR